MNWDRKITTLATHILASSRGYPLLAKEAAWQAAKFVVRVGISNPVSFVLRPIFAHKHLRIGLGMGMAVIAMLVCGWSPSFAGADTGGKVEINLLPAGEVNLETIQAVRLPVDNFRITQRFWAFHPGLDMSAPTGTPVHPVMAGAIKQILRDRYDYGNHIIVDHGNGFESLYAHLSKIEAREGDQVNTKSEIGQVGSTGHSSGPHLHLEIRQNGAPTNPATILGIK